MTETSWVAGLLEGEGYFGVNRYGATYRPSIVLGMKDYDVVDHARSVLGLEHHRITSRKDGLYLLQAQKWDDVARIGLQLFEFMGARRQAAIANQLEMGQVRRDGLFGRISK